MTALFRVGVALAFAACIAGCAIEPAIAPSAVVTSSRVRLIPADRVKDGVVIAKSTKEDVIASFGKTLVINFDSGYEIWVYRLADDRRAEFVILFAPSGLVAKTRTGLFHD